MRGKCRVGLGVGMVILLAVFLFMPFAHGATTTVFNNENGAAVMNNPTGGNPQFTVSQPSKLEYVRTYHWNSGRGATPGTIWLQGGPNNQQYGPWQASASATFWVVQPTGVNLPAGSYKVFDSGQATWSHNAQTGNKGFALVNINPIVMQGLPIEDGKGVVNSFRPADRPVVIELLDLDAKGPVKAHFGLRPFPDVVVNKPVVRVGDIAMVSVTNGYEGYSYYFEVLPGPAYSSPLRGPYDFQVKPGSPGIFTVVVKTKPNSVRSAPPYEWKRVTITAQ